MGQKLITKQLAFVVLLILQCSLVKADYPKEVEISTIQKSIRIGEPLILNTKLRFENPQVSKEGNILDSRNPEMSIRIYQKEDLSNRIFMSRRRHLIYQEDNEGLNYSGNIILLYDNFKDKLIFEQPGIYKITLNITQTIAAEPFYITVKPPKERVKKMLSLLSDPNDFAFFSYGTYGSGDYFRNRPDRIQYLKKVVDEFEDTVLAQMIAAQIGVESSIQFQDNHTSYMFYDEERQKDLLDGSLFKQAHKYLTIGDKLPDEFPIREEVLKELGIAEFVKGNHEKAFALLDELSNKYPKGEHGRKASKGKQELIELQKRKQKSPN